MAQFLDDMCDKRGWVTRSPCGTHCLPNIKVVAGKARGADTMAVDWAVTRFCQFCEYPADWDKHGKSAGHIRNKQMIVCEEPDLVVAFPGGRGTANMIKQAQDAGIETIIITNELYNSYTIHNPL